METESLKDLLDKYAEGRCTPEEAARLETWYLYLNENKRAVLSEEELRAAELKLESVFAGRLPAKTRPLWPRIAAAAAVLLVILFGIQQLVIHRHTRNEAITERKDIVPGSDQAVLTLADGSKITLKNAKKGALVHQGSALVSIGAGSRLIYNVQGKTQAAFYNTLSTPAGGQYPLELADGTKVWLDAASSITYPVTFTGKRREVKVTGQAYFEVAHDPAKPFIVTTATQYIEVLGTHFNVNAYTDEPAVKTTLMEGKVKVVAYGREALLGPGQQAKNSGGEIIVSKEKNPGEAVAWHNGMFEFHNADVPEVMRQLARWYNVEVSYEGKIPQTTFSGEIYRNYSALKVSDILSYEKIHFRIEGRRIIVLP